MLLAAIVNMIHLQVDRLPLSWSSVLDDRLVTATASLREATCEEFNRLAGFQDLSTRTIRSLQELEELPGDGPLEASPDVAGAFALGGVGSSCLLLDPMRISGALTASLTQSKQSKQPRPLTWGFGARREGFEPPTARSVAWCSTSIWSAPDRSGLLRLDASSVQTDPVGSRRIVWMIKRMIKRLGRCLAIRGATSAQGTRF
jgi:hypothetical protein